ncbi:hypothetical protein MSAN_00956100 [Mycena sanguinolenta]|uniref:Uncharacterized protein n=1 Tax=Mycena sanguinolenta TaxID=230812 RepID=A0A8H6YXE2_9AGAR|nr:hypothetical protein MSAN_00956100 [Mycena sanguinolenta]
MHLAIFAPTRPCRQTHPRRLTLVSLDPEAAAHSLDSASVILRARVRRLSRISRLYLRYAEASSSTGNELVIVLMHQAFLGSFPILRPASTHSPRHPYDIDRRCAVHGRRRCRAAKPSSALLLFLALPLAFGPSNPPSASLAHPARRKYMLLTSVQR